MGRATGIQIGTSAVRVVDVEGTPKKMKLKGFGSALIDHDVSETDAVGALTKALRDALKESKAARDQVVLGIPVRDCIIREVTIPFTDPDQIKKVIKFEAEPHFHSCSIDDVVICFHKVADLGNRSTLLVIAARKDRLAIPLQAMERVGIDPLSIDIDASGLYAASRIMASTAAVQNCVVLEIGLSTTTLTLVAGGNLRIVRSVRIGTDSITSRVGRDLEIGHAEARTRTMKILEQDFDLEQDLFVRKGDVTEDDQETKKTSGELERDIVRQRRSELMTRLVQEIQRSVNSAKLNEPLEAIFVCGTGSMLPRLEEELAQQTGTPVHAFEVLPEIEHKVSAADADRIGAEIATGLGLAAKNLGFDPLGFDYRQEEFVFTKRFDRLKVPLFMMVILMVVVNLAWFVYELKLTEHEDTKLSEMAKRAAKPFNAIVDPDGDPNVRKFIDPDGKELNKVFKGARDDQFESGYERIGYMSSQLTRIRRKLRKDYDLGGAVSTRRKKDAKKKETSDFISALQRWEETFTALKSSGLKDYAIDRLVISTEKVDMDLALPKSDTDLNLQVSAFEESMRKVAGATGYDRLEWTGTIDEYTDDKHMLAKRLVFHFEREKSRAGGNRR